MNLVEQEWITNTAAQAKAAEHCWPFMAACEAALESASVINGVRVFGGSALAREGNNLFGMKQKKHPIHGTLTLPTHEYLDGKWEPVTADWVKYDNLAECFEDRMATLRYLAPHYPHYAAALAATDPFTYVQEVSRTWSTDPARADKCIAIYREYNDAQPPSEPPQLGVDQSTGIG